MKTHSSPLGVIYSGSVQEGLVKAVDQLSPSSVFILADSNTADLCVPFLQEVIPGSDLIVIPAGEQHKNLTSCQHVWSELIMKKADRGALLLNAGGGMICDLGGFAASCYQRGILHANIPTSVLAMADAAIGGKTGIDFEGLKNYIGSFRVPAFVWVDDEFLNTLPRAEKISGLAEIVKHAIIRSQSLFEKLAVIAGVDQVPWKEILEENLPVKLKIAEEDPEEKGLRKILNFGHTIGHALESHFLNSPEPLTHGQCVCLGMLVEAKISKDLGLLNKNDFNAIVTIVRQLLDPVRISIPTFAVLKDWIRKDKKKHGEEIGFSLPDGIGSCRWGIPVKNEVIASGMEWLAQAQVATERLE